MKEAREAAYPVAVIGGSGLYDMDDLVVHEEREIPTPFGDPSDVFVLGEIDAGADEPPGETAGETSAQTSGRTLRVAFLSRHGRGHALLPTEINFRANVWAAKSLGVRFLISASAVGSLQERYAPRHVVVPDQFIDRTRHRPDTFFGDGLVAHVGLADPFCPVLSALMAEAAEEASAGDDDVQVHRGGTYVCMEGPQFSTRAESELYRSWGADVIGMTNLQEAKLAREAEICYATFAMITDYDCWHETEEDVSVEAVLGVLRDNARTAQAAVRAALRRLAAADLEPAGEHSCPAALATALITDKSVVPAETIERLAPIVGRYFAED